MARGVAESVGARIGYRAYNAERIPPRLLVAACGDRLFARAPYPCAEMDLRGLGSSRVALGSPRAFDLKSYLADFDAVLRETGRSRNTALLGYSHAGYFVTAYALANPNKVSALVLVEPALFTSRAELLKRARLASAGKVRESVSAMLSYVGARGASDVRDTVVGAIQSGDAVAAEWRVRAENPISPRRLASLKMPVLLIGGSESKQSDSVTKAASVIPNAKVWWIHGADHLGLVDAKHNRELNEVVGAFLNSLQK